MSANPYSRIYWSVMDDIKFNGIREDVRLFGAWSLLLVVADMAWPSSAYVPRTIPPAAFRKLVACELVDELPGHRFQLHGLDAERGKRQQYARDAAAVRWQSEGNAEPMLDRDRDIAEEEPRQSRDISQETGDPADTYWRLTGKYPAGKALTWIDNLSAEFGSEPTTKAIAREFITLPDTSNLLTRAQNALRSEARKLSVKEREAEAERLREKRSRPVQLEPWREQYRAEIEARYGKGA